MSKKKLNRAKRKWIIYSGFLPGIFIAILFSVNAIIGGLVRKEFDKKLNSNPESLYQLKYEKLNVNIFTGSIIIKNISFQPVDSLQKELSDRNIKKLFRAEIKKFKLNNLNIFRFLRNNELKISAIIIENLMVDYYFMSDSKETSGKQTFMLQNLFSENFHGAKVNALKFTNTTLRFTNISAMDQPIFEIDSVTVVVNDILLNEETIEHSIPISFSGININTGHFSLNSSEYYSIKTQGIHFNLHDSSIVINGFKLIPKYDKYEFNKRISYNDDWFNIKTQNLKLNHININLLQTKKQLEIGSVEIVEPEIEIYRDKRLPDAPFKYKPLLAGMIKKIPIDLHIDTLHIIRGKLSYEEQVDISDKPGLVFFDPLFISVYNVTNNPAQILINPDMQLVFRGKIMGQSFLNANFEIKLNRSDEYFTTTGTLDPIAASAFNPFVKNALSVQINKGRLSKTEFSFKANDNESEGTLVLNYENLHVEVLKHDDQTKKSGFMSFVANEVIRKKNLEANKKYIIGDIGFERRKDRAIVNFVWNSCKTGIISIVAPIADKNKKKVKQVAKEEKKETKAKKRKEKKEKRQKK